MGRKAREATASNPRGLAIEQALLCRARRKSSFPASSFVRVEKQEEETNRLRARRGSLRWGIFLCSRKFSILPATCS
jgi:hypothetical protein